MKKTQYSVIITFLIVMATIFVCSLFPNGSGFSSFENRKLSGKPELSLKSIFNGKYESGYESYLLDNFPFRNFSVQSYQTYTELFFLDVFTKNEDILMKVDVDNFVSAQKPESIAEAQLTSGQEATGQSAAGQPGAGGQSAAGQQEAGGNTATGQGPTVASAGSGEQQADGGRPIAGDATPNKENIGQGSAAQSTEGQPDITSSEGGQGDGATTDSGQGNAVSTDDGQQSTVEQDSQQEQGDNRLNDSLIISGDRVMMPTGANNLKAYGNVLTKIAEALPGKNIYSITGPTSAAFFASKKYSTGSYDQSRAESIIESSVSGVKVVKAYDILLGHRDENIYFRSDVHWTALGAYYAYNAFCQSAGFAPASLDNDFTMDTYKPFLGGLYSQIYKQPQAVRLKNHPEQLDYYIPKVGHQLTLYTMGNLKAPNSVDSIINTNFSSLGAYKYSCFAWGDQRIEKIDSDAPSGRKLLVVKDSYGSALIPFLVPNYSKIYVIDPKGFNQKGSLSFDAKKLIKDEEIDDVILCFSIYGSGRSIIQNGLTSLFLK